MPAPLYWTGIKQPEPGMVLEYLSRTYEWLPASYVELLAPTGAHRVQPPGSTPALIADVVRPVPEKTDSTERHTIEYLSHLMAVHARFPNTKQSFEAMATMLYESGVRIAADPRRSLII